MIGAFKSTKRGCRESERCGGTASVVLPDRRHRCLLLVSGNEVIMSAHFVLSLEKSVLPVVLSQLARKEE